MPAVTTSKRPQGAGAGPSVPRTLVLARLACTGEVSRAGLARDLAPLLDHEFSPEDWRERAEAEIADLRRERLAAETRGGLSPTQSGRHAADRALGNEWPALLSWPEQRDIRLLAKALGLENETRAMLEGLIKPGGARAVILQQAFGLPIKPTQSITRLRAQLAVVALERAFGNKIKSGFGQGSGLSAKAGRLLAGHLSRNPRDFGADGRLLAALAAEQAGASRTDEEALRLAVLRRFVSRGLGARKSGEEPAVEAPPLPSPGADHSAAGSRSSLAVRPDLSGFAAEVRAAARQAGEGWPRKAYISRVWEAVRSSAPQWALTEIEFKCMLAEAHRAGQVHLASADLKDKRYMKDIEASAITYKNTVWHFVRVED